MSLIRFVEQLDVLSCVFLKMPRNLNGQTRTFALPALWNDLVAEFEVCIVGVTRTGEIVLSRHYSDLLSLIYYNLERNTLTKVEVQGLRTFRHWEAHTFLDHVEDVKHGGVFRTT
ncbi:unnamed protein product [Microthlaspi erraticum]|uniref:F-box associated beta-propeller type 3 domain-containing protein n=1 Tax=Microthlaspi erraticum TaxID=1685480 RepID=A0A6D2K1B0_9BRAS|nr:unnamed protein product [Microthlaspi erraticum]